MKTAITLALTLAVTSLTNAAEPHCPMHPNAPPELSANHDCCRLAQEEWAATLAKITATDESLFQVESNWTNQNGKKQPLGQLSGKPQLVAMVYTNCQYACPRIIADLKSLESELADWSSNEFGITIISIDPERDTPERLLEYSTDNNLNLDHWTLLHGDASDVLELANLLGVRYQKTPTGDFSHSNIITLLNAQGEIVHQQNGLGSDNAPTLDKLNEIKSHHH